jgi:uncharacterized protein YcnI
MQKSKAFLIATAILIPSIALAHAVVFPKASAPGAYEKYVLRVPNERDVPTTRVELRFPPGLRVVSFGDVAGWNLQILRDSAQHITGAVWTGVLPKERFVEFPFVAVNPTDSARLTWPTIQTYQGGEVVNWTDPDSAAKNPVSATVVAKTQSVPLEVSHTSLYVAVGALAFALIALSLSVASRRRGAEPTP